MDTELKQKLKNAPVVNRREIYEYTNATGTYSGLCIIVSASHRERDKYVSAIALSPCDRDEGLHNDEVGITLPDNRKFWVHCGMVTYIRRDRIGKLVHKITKQHMRRIDKNIMYELDLSIKADDEPDYEKMYHDLIKTIANWSKPEKKTAWKKGEKPNE